VVRKVRILLADDQPMICEAVAKLLKPTYEIVASVADGQALIQAAVKMNPDVIVTDISMPVLNGIEAANKLRDAGSPSRIVFLTIHQDLDYIRACFAAGAVAYVSKPRMRADLLSAIQEALVGHSFVSPVASSAIVGTVAKKGLGFRAAKRKADDSSREGRRGDKER
jgi:DNA-binding NarL/FixJ family response regulator